MSSRIKIIFVIDNNSYNVVPCRLLDRLFTKRQLSSISSMSEKNPTWRNLLTTDIATFYNGLRRCGFWTGAGQPE